METLERLGWKYTFTHRPTHTYIMLLSHSRGSLINLQSFFFFFFALLPHLEAAHEQFSFCLLMVFHKALWDIFYTSIRAIISLTEKAVSPAQPCPSPLCSTRVVSWHALVKQCTSTARIKGFAYCRAYPFKAKQNKYLSLALNYRLKSVTNGSKFNWATLTWHTYELFL